MGKTAFMFPGQGAQYPGMAKDTCDAFKEAKDVFDEAVKVSGIDYRDMIFNGNEDTLKITENTQPAILIASIALLRAFQSKVNKKPDAVLGLSLGEYTAHVASGSIDFGESVNLVKKRGKFMQEAVPEGVGMMAAIVGLSDVLVEEACAQTQSEGIVQPANYNCPGQIVIAGEVKAVEKAMEIALQKGAKRVIKLAVSAPFHTKMLQPAADKLSVEMDKINIKNFSIPVVSNTTAGYYPDCDLIKELLIKQVMSPVLFEKSINMLIEDGFDTFIEIGPGKALTGFVKKISKDAVIYNVGNIDEISQVAEKWGA